MNHKTLPLVSLAIPVFNGADFMCFAIDSAIAQSYPNIEIIVVNDGSNDGGQTEKIALSYGNRIKYFSKTNGGVGSALNFALNKSRGEYFCWLSHDDQYLQDKVLKQVEFLQSLPTADAVVFCRHSVINAHGELLQELPPPPQFNPETVAYQLLLNQWLHCCTILAPRAMYLDVGGFREDLPTTQDYDMLMKIGLKYPFFEIPEILLQARSHPNQGSLTLLHQYEVERFFDEHIPMLSSEYMSRCFSPHEIVSAWEALGVQMRVRNIPKGVIAVLRQMMECKVVTANPDLLLDAIRHINSDQQSIAHWQSQATHWQSQATHWQSQATHWQSQATQISIELGYCRSSWSQKSMNYLKELVKRIISRFVAISRLQLKSPSRVIFDNIYKENYWRGESRSGEGSDLVQTQHIREVFPSLLKSLNAKSMLDIPCGDFFWMRHVDLPVAYIGADIVKDLVNINNKKFSDNKHKFLHLDVTNDKLPQVDLIFARDLLVHLSYNDIRRTIQNMKKSGSTWLLTTTFTARDTNIDIKTGDWRTLNLQLAPFNFPEPVNIINEGCTQFNGDFSDKCLGLWKLQDLEL